MQTKKSPKASQEKMRKLYFNIGLIVALAITLAAFEYKVPIEKYSLPDSYSEIEDIEIWDEIVRVEKVPEKPKPKPIKEKAGPIDPEKLQPDDSKTEQKTGEEDMANISLDLPENLFPEENPDPLEHSTPFMRVEQMPYLCNCENIRDNEARELCTDAELMKFFAQNLKYPRIAKKNKEEGKVYVRFVVDKAGNVTEVSLKNSVSPSLDREAKRVVSSIPCYIPGRQVNKPVPVEFTVPISFTLD